MKIAIIGAGGVGSWLCRFIDKAMWANQIPEDAIFDIFDADNVAIKNIYFQDYVSEDVGINKAESIKKKYSVTFRKSSGWFEEKLFYQYDVFLIAVDNFKLRENLFKYCDETNKYYIDMRAEGNMVFVMNKCPLSKSLATIDNTDTSAGSCQLDIDIRNNQLKYSNIVAASIGFNWLLNYIRGDKQEQLTAFRI